VITSRGANAAAVGLMVEIAMADRGRKEFRGRNGDLWGCLDFFAILVASLVSLEWKHRTQLHRLLHLAVVPFWLSYSKVDCRNHWIRKAHCLSSFSNQQRHAVKFSRVSSSLGICILTQRQTRSCGRHRFYIVCVEFTR
jgi:hypothetical protein